MKKILFTLLSFISAITLFAQNTETVPEVVPVDVIKLRERIAYDLPQLKGYQTLTSDLHVHSFFSDGQASPKWCVYEAWGDGLDVFAMTDHIEYRQNKDFIVADQNKSFELAQKANKDLGLILIKGAEITRKKPFGHMNCLFITDANKLEVEDPVEALKIARSQGGLVQWNHPGWPDKKCTMYDLDLELISKGMIDIVEVFNTNEYYPKAFDWVNQYNLAPGANSDNHYPTGSMYGKGKFLRPMTLIFAEERSLESVKSALIQRRTAACIPGGTIMAVEKIAKEMFEGAISIRFISEDKEDYLVTEFTAKTDLPLVLNMIGSENIDKINGHTACRINIKKDAKYQIMNFYTGCNKMLEVTLSDYVKH